MTVVWLAPGGVSLIITEAEHPAGHLEVEENFDLPACGDGSRRRVRLVDVRVPKSNVLGEEGQVVLARHAFVGSGASTGTLR